MKIALITGITGQDGSYLAELLLEKGYEVHGIVRRSSLINTHRIDHIYDSITLHYGDLTDATNLVRVIKQVQPDEIYNLGAQSHVNVSFEMPEYTADVDGMGTLRVLEAVRLLGMEDRVRIYQASTSELYGLVQETPQKETTPFYPRSPYGVAKLYAHWIARNYRESYGMFISTGILFIHEGERRGLEFVTRKITNAVAKIYLGRQEYITLGDLWPKRDWGYAGDYVRGMWQMLQHDEPDDFVLATGETHSIEEFLALAFAEVGISDWRPYVQQDPRYMRPAEVDILLGDPSKAERVLGWRREVDFRGLVHRMVRHDLELVGQT